VAGRVVRISVAPVKSLGLVHPREVELSNRGVVGNRRFWLVDADRRLYNNKRNGPLVRIRPEWDEETRELGLTFADGTRVSGVVADEEDGWIGTPVRVGEATVKFNGDVGRCVVTTHDPDTGVSTVDTLEALARYRREGRKEPLPFGVYGSVLVPGRVRVGVPV